MGRLPRAPLLILGVAAAGALLLLLLLRIGEPGDAPTRPTGDRTRSPRERTILPAELARGGLARSEPDAGAAPGEGATSSVPPAQVEGSIAGVVVDEEGTPVAGARVDLAATAGLVDPGLWRTDAQGRFEVRFRHDQDRPRRIRVRAPGFAHATTTEHHAGGDSLWIVLHPGARIVGRVVDPEDRPVAGAVVVLAARRSFQRTFLRSGATTDVGDADAWGRAVTDAAGRFALVDLRADPVQVRALGTGPHAPSAPVRVDPPTGDVLLSLRPGLVVEGVVVDGDDVPIASAHVALAEVHEDGWPSRTEGMTDEAGRFRFAGLLAGQTSIEASHPDHGARRREGVAIGGAPVVLVLERNGQARFVVLDDAGDPVADAWAVAVDEDGWPLTDADAAADDEGRLVLRGLGAGRHGVWIHAEGKAPAFLPDVVAGGADRVVRLEEGLSITGRCLAGGRPRSMDVYAVPAGMRPDAVVDPLWDFPASRLGAGDGAFRIGGLRAGTYDLVVLTSTNDAYQGSVVLPSVEAGASDVVADLPAGVAIRARVVDAEGRPAFVIRAQARDERGFARSLADVPAGGASAVALGGLVPGTYTVVVWTAERRRMEFEGVRAPEDDVVILLP